MTPLMTLAFLMLGTPLTHEGRQGVDPAVAPRRHRWTVVRLTADWTIHVPRCRSRPWSRCWSERRIVPPYTREEKILAIGSKNVTPKNRHAKSLPSFYSS